MGATCFKNNTPWRTVVKEKAGDTVTNPMDIASYFPPELRADYSA